MFNIKCSEIKTIALINENVDIDKCQQFFGKIIPHSSKLKQ